MENNKKIKYLPANQTGKDYIVGDLHGCYSDLIQALDALSFDKANDRLFSVGDLIDRGEENEKCIHLINEPWFHAVRGNHEDMMVSSMLDGYALNMWIFNGGNWSMKYGVEQLDVVMKLADLVNTLPHVIVVGKDTPARFNVVHAEFPADTDDQKIDSWNFSDQDEGKMLWGRSLIVNPALYAGHQHQEDWTIHNGMSKTYCGHTPLNEPVELFNQYYIDCGAVYYYLNQTAIDISDKRARALVVCEHTADGPIVYKWSMHDKQISSGEKITGATYKLST